ncbi:hypothetical protein Pelo_4729 [Pelomyxa schiedti]|nr:hypothetical protein Pelo_4729 [Pelomyxa schiedti]
MGGAETHPSPPQARQLLHREVHQTLHLWDNEALQSATKERAAFFRTMVPSGYLNDVQRASGSLIVAKNFKLVRPIVNGCNGIVYEVKCIGDGHPALFRDQSYALKMPYNYGLRTESVLNAFENEYLICSTLEPHPNVIQYFCHFTDRIPQEYYDHLPAVAKELAYDAAQKRMHASVWVVLAHHSETLKQFLGALGTTFQTTPWPIVHKYSRDICAALVHLFVNQTLHFDVSLDNIVISYNKDQAILADLGCARKFPATKNKLFEGEARDLMHALGNQAHRAPEIINGIVQYGQNPGHSTLHYDKQPSFELGCILFELAMCGKHPLPGYPGGYGPSGHITFSFDSEELFPMKSTAFPRAFCNLVRALLQFDAEKRMPLLEAAVVLAGIGVPNPTGDPSFYPFPLTDLNVAGTGTLSVTTSNFSTTNAELRLQKRHLKQRLRETESKLLLVSGKKFKGAFCRFRGGEMALVDLNRLDLGSAIPLGGGSNGYVNSVAVLPQVNSAMSLTPQPVATGMRVALKMMLNYSAGIQTKQQRAFFDREAEVGLISPHWCFCNIFSIFRADTKLSLIPGKHHYVLVKEDMKYVDPTYRSVPEEAPVFSRTTYITMELGKYTLQSVVAQTFDRSGAQQGVPPLSRSDLLQASFCLLCACSHLNSKGWLHCDIKLDNVLALERPGMTGQIWALCDFGTSLFSPRNGEFLIPLGESFSGNAMNRAPECHTPQRLPSGSCKYMLGKNDVWAAGCVLYEAVSGQHPYYRANQIDLNLLLSKSAEPFTVPSPRREANPEVSALASYLLERDHTKRPSAKQAMLVIGALTFLPRQSLSQFATDHNSSALHSQVWTAHEASVSAMETCATSHTPPTVNQLSALVFTCKALKDLELFTSTLLGFLEIFSKYL